MAKSDTTQLMFEVRVDLKKRSRKATVFWRAAGEKQFDEIGEYVVPKKHKRNGGISAPGLEPIELMMGGFLNADAMIRLGEIKPLPAVRPLVRRRPR